MAIHAVLFDIDGTLLDTREFIYQAFEYTLRHHGLPPMARESLAPLMGTPLEKVYVQIVPDKDAAVLSATHREFQRHNSQLVKAYPGVADVLAELRQRQVKTAVITSRKEHVISSLEHTGVFRLVDIVVTGDDVQHHKPHPEGLLKALYTLKVVPEQAAMVGDMPPDIEAGRAADCTTIGVTWGFFGPAIQEVHPDYVINDMQELLTVI